MPSPTLTVHIRRRRGQIQSGKQNAQPRGMFRLNPRLRSGQEKPLDALVPESPDHIFTVTYDVTLCTSHFLATPGMFRVKLKWGGKVQIAIYRDEP